ncbi:hypothetical protein OIU76_026707 [Salix suchowensis]|nr:hypothetical protein OIU76_026707 [Salix suchowensis]
MEGLNGILRKATHETGFKHHWRCRNLDIVHQCFAGDLIMFSHADPTSVQVLKSALDKIHFTGCFSIASTWDLLWAYRPTTNMQYILWHPLHSFILWLASQGKLHTMDRIHNVNVEDHSCKLCNQAAETHEHLFFQCQFSAQIWQSVNNKANMH